MLSDSHENRYHSLLQPIKDIASNWDIDIAESLTEYLDELDQLRISMDGGKTNLNFAEAALLIQGSTAVYSKKVEYLYSLVLKSLDFISNKKTNNGKSTKQLMNNKSIDDEDYLLFETDSSFLLLDHVIDEGQNINLKTKSTTNHLRTSRNSRESNNSISTDTSRVSMSLMHSILNDNQGSSSLKLSTSIIDGSGALLLCGALPSMMNNSRNSNTRNSFLSNSKASPIPQPIDVSNVQYDHQDNDYFDDNDCGDMDDNHNSCLSLPPPWNTIEHDNNQQSNHLRVDLNNDLIKKVNLNECTTPKKSIATTTIASKPFAKPVFRDMFKQLDPHQIIPGSKEVRKGKTYKIPIALLKPQDKKSTLDLLYSNAHDNTISLLQSNTLPTKGLFDHNLMPILKIKRKLIRQARLSAIKEQVNTNDDAMDINPINSSTRYQNFDINIASNANETSRVEQLWIADYGDDNNDDVYDDNVDNDMMDHGEYDHEPLSFPNHYAGEDQHYEDIDYVYNEEEELARRLQNVLNEDLNKSNRNSYESICQQYINEFNRGADLFARETQLSRRVSDWTQKLEPILQRQEEEEQFDIHAYCDNFISEVDVVAQNKQYILNEHCESGMNNTINNNMNIGFSDIAHGKKSVEVCRIFLACLQLTNQGNISIIPNETISKNKNNQAILTNNDSFDDKVDPFSISLTNNSKNKNSKNQILFNFPQENVLSSNNDVENMKISNELENKMKKTIRKHKVKFDSNIKMTSICNNIAEIII